MGEEAKKRLSDLVLNRAVRVKLLGKDQYGRAVGELFYRPVRLVPFITRNASDVMLGEGMGVVYQQGGAVYGKGEVGKRRKEKLLEIEARAREARKGVWGLGGETPAEFKARMKQAEVKTGE